MRLSDGAGSWTRMCNRGAPTTLSRGVQRASTASFLWSPRMIVTSSRFVTLETRRRTRLQLRGQSPAAERGGPRAAGLPLMPSWPRALRAVRAWLSPWIALQRWWPAWSKAPPPPQLQALINSVAAGCGLHLYIPN